MSTNFFDPKRVEKNEALKKRIEDMGGYRQINHFKLAQCCKVARSTISSSLHNLKNDKILWERTIDRINEGLNKYIALQ